MRAVRRRLLVRRLRRERFGWGGAAWTDPIPAHPRVEGYFWPWPWRAWSLAENTRTGERFLLRPDRSGEWAEVKPAA